MRIKNDTGVGQTLVVRYTGEQWRDASTAAQSLQFSYQVSSAAITSADAANAPGGTTTTGEQP